MYSFGVVLWELVTHDTPIRGRLYDPRVPEQCPQEIADLIHECLRSRASERPTIKQAFTRIKVSADNAAHAAAEPSPSEGCVMP